MIPKVRMRLYRGLTRKYQPEKVGKNHGPLAGTDFTDCPYRALSFARGTRGVVLVVDVPEEDGSRAREALWSLDGTGPKRFILYGRFDQFLVAEIPATELRSRIRKKGIVTLPDSDKDRILGDYIAEWNSAAGSRRGEIAGQVNLPLPTTASEGHSNVDAEKRHGKRKRTSALEELEPTEALEVLRTLLKSHPGLKEEAEGIATSLIADTSFEAVAEDVEWNLEGPDLDDLNSRAGRHRSGYVGPNDAAYEILREAIEPTIQEMRRQIQLGLDREALETCKGLILGLYGVRKKESGGCLAWAPDFPEDTAGEIINEWIGERKQMGKTRSFPRSFIDQHVPEWKSLFDRIFKS